MGTAAHLTPLAPAAQRKAEELASIGELVLRI
jgi:hypothetical protein